MSFIFVFIVYLHISDLDFMIPLSVGVSFPAHKFCMLIVTMQSIMLIA